MTSEQICPLCGEEVGFYGDDYEDGEIECSNVDCSLWAKNFTLSDFRTLLSQIARIKQEAKQELINEFDAEFEVMENEATDEELITETEKEYSSLSNEEKKNLQKNYKYLFDSILIYKAHESEREKTRTQTAKEIFEKLENAFETILGYDAKGEDVLCWENFVKVRDAILINKKETETKVKE